MYELRRPLHHAAQLCRVGGIGVVAERRGKLVAAFFVFVFQQLFAKLLYLVYDVPCLLFVHRAAYVVENPRQFLVVLFQPVNPHIHSLVFYLFVRQFDAQVRREVEFARKISQHRLEETVDCLNAEECVVVQKVVHRHVCASFHKSLVDFLVGEMRCGVLFLQLFNDDVRIRL